MRGLEFCQSTSPRSLELRLRERLPTDPAPVPSQDGMGVLRCKSREPKAIDKTIVWIEDDTDVIDPVVRPLERVGHQFTRLHTMR
jgi:hypothetical protein